MNVELLFIHDEKMEVKVVLLYQKIYPKQLWKKLHDPSCLPTQKVKNILPINLNILSKIPMVALWHNP
jgi:hypothetical protein